nr:glycolate oxidase [Candidatus Dadabacteria bacterium]
MKEYSDLLADDPEYLEKALEISSKTKDIMEFIAEIGIDSSLFELNKRVTYQDACHIAHGQKITSQPREL